MTSSRGFSAGLTSTLIVPDFTESCPAFFAYARGIRRLRGRLHYRFRSRFLPAVLRQSPSLSGQNVQGGTMLCRAASGSGDATALGTRGRCAIVKDAAQNASRARLRTARTRVPGATHPPCPVAVHNIGLSERGRTAAGRFHQCPEPSSHTLRPRFGGYRQGPIPIAKTCRDPGRKGGCPVSCREIRPGIRPCEGNALFGWTS